LIQPIDDLAVAAMVIDQALHRIATETPALVARHATIIELADQITEEDCAVAGIVAIDSR
jgi:hypothetical protein